LHEIFGVVPDDHSVIDGLPVGHLYQLGNEVPVVGVLVEFLADVEQVGEVADVEEGAVSGGEQLADCLSIEGEVVELLVPFLAQEDVLVVGTQLREAFAGDVVAHADGIHRLAAGRVCCESAPAELSHRQFVVAAGLALAVPVAEDALNRGKPRFEQFLNAEDLGFVKSEVGDQGNAGIQIVEVDPLNPGRVEVRVSDAEVVVLP
jgi:hypothetical protein